MGMNVYLYKFDKKANSTKQPTMQVGDKGISVEMKEVTNMFSPTLIVTSAIFESGGTLYNPMRYTYCYILRSASKYDNRIPDTHYPAKAGRRCVARTVTNPWTYNMDTNNLSNGFFVVGIGNSDTSAIGSVSYYMFTGTGMRTFMNKLMTNPAWLNVSDPDYTTDLQKAMTNPLQYIISCVWIPLSFASTTPTAITSIPYGWWSISGITAYRLQVGHLMMTRNVGQFSIPSNPYSNGDKQKWLNYSPWTECFVECSPFGTVSIDPTVLMSSSDNRIYVSVDVDCITGRGQLRVTIKDAANNYIFVCGSNGQVGVQVPVAQMSVNYEAATSVSTWIQTGAVVVAKNWSTFKENVPQMLENAKAGLPLFADTAYDNRYNDTSANSIISDIGDGLSMAAGTCSMQGSAGGFAGFLHAPSFICYYSEPVQDDGEHVGYPYCKTGVINTFSGFVLCGNADNFTANCMQAERQEIIRHLETGFYYE